MRIMAIDYGDARTGIAISDPTGLLTGFSTVIPGRRPEVVADAVAELARDHEVTELVLGYPKNMNNSIGPRAEKSAAFAQLLEARTGLPVHLWDERLTTVDSHRILSETGRRGRQRKARVDAVAASLILEGYLDLRRRQSGSL
ncbi:MAG: Holliday junction resolvase RuvX [Oscillospiraceae bacterium]|nr:Holliday junction resolvase RuvX [Oscillospiraceae bacterium]